MQRLTVNVSITFRLVMGRTCSSCELHDWIECGAMITRHSRRSACKSSSKRSSYLMVMRSVHCMPARRAQGSSWLAKTSLCFGFSRAKPAATDAAVMGSPVCITRSLSSHGEILTSFTSSVSIHLVQLYATAVNPARARAHNIAKATEQRPKLQNLSVPMRHVSQWVTTQGLSKGCGRGT
jgi:hypothetical protein